MKSFLLETLQKQYPKAFSALAKLIYDYDCEVWESSGRKLPKPGEQQTGYDHNNIHYPKETYGEWRLNSTNPKQLKDVLKTFSNEAIESALRSIA